MDGKRTQLPGHPSASDWCVRALSCLLTTWACNLVQPSPFPSASACPGGSKCCWGARLVSTLCGHRGHSETFKEHLKSPQRGNGRYLAPTPVPPTTERESEYTKLEKHTQNGCLKFTAVNIQYLVREKECRKQRVNKIAADGRVDGWDPAGLAALLAEPHLHPRTKVPCWRPFLSNLLLQKAPGHPQ